MATHSSILAWKVSWAEEPGGLQSMGVTKSQTQLNSHTHTYTHTHTHSSNNHKMKLRKQFYVQ